VKIIIPYNHSNLDQDCDFIFQTIIALLNKNNCVILILRNHPVSLPTLLWNFFAKKQTDECKKVLMKVNLIHSSNLKIFQPIKLFPKSLSNLSLVIKIFEQRLNLYLSILIIFLTNPDIIWSFDHQNFDIFQKIFKKYFTIYDCVDHYTSLKKDTDKVIKEQEHVLISHSTLVVVNSETLQKKFASKGIKTTLVPQGFDVKSTESEFRLPDWIKTLSYDLRKKIIFVGNPSHRIDYPLLLSIVKANPKVLFLLPDEVFTWQSENEIIKIKESVKKFKNLSNIQWIPRSSRKVIFKLIKLSNICIIPYDISQKFNKYSFSMELFEYFYAGKPVLSTPIVELTKLQFDGLIYTGNTAKEWQTHLKKLLISSWPESKIKQQKQIAYENTWDKKIEVILTNITRKRILVIRPVQRDGQGIVKTNTHATFKNTIIDHTFLETGPDVIDSTTDAINAEQFVKQKAIWAQKQGYDAVVIDCMYDPGIKSLKKNLQIPIVGTKEAVLEVTKKLNKTAHFVYPEGIPILELENRKKEVIQKLTKQIQKIHSQNPNSIYIIGCTIIDDYAEELSRKTNTTVLGNVEFAIDHAAKLINEKILHSNTPKR
jgi:Asp/Glu/hydantoin racemase